MAFAPYRATLVRRLMAGYVLTDDGCWRWLGAHSPKGYGVINVTGVTMRVHRVAYEVWREQIPTDKEINHTCHTRDCYNPAHLEAVTHDENIQKRSGKSYTLDKLSRPQPTHCHYGHEYTEKNILWVGGKYRACRVCHNQAVARYKYLRKAG